MIFTHLLFPTPVFTSYYECDNQLKTSLNSFKFRDVNYEYIKNFGESSIDTYVLDSTCCTDLKQYLVEISTSVMQEALCLNVGKAKITQSWITVKNKNQSHGIHNHPNSILSGVYYYDNYDTSVEPIIFHKNTATTTYELQVDVSKDKHNPISSQTFSITPTNGLIVLFPSYVKHSVETNFSDIPRKSIAFNVVPETGFGCKGGFSELYVL